MTKTKTINGIAFEISQPYEAGQTIGEAEARALNQTRSENIGNNVRAKLKELQEANAPESEMQALVAEADANYVFSIASVSAARKLDPYEREARNLAKQLIKENLAKSGRKLTDIPAGSTKEEWEAKVEAEIERIATADKVVAAAKKIVDQKRKSAESLLEAVGGTEV